MIFHVLLTTFWFPLRKFTLHIWGNRGRLKPNRIIFYEYITFHVFTGIIVAMEAMSLELVINPNLKKKSDIKKKDSFCDF